jgi:proteasome lid subunit RPN8/RPN11
VIARAAYDPAEAPLTGLALSDALRDEIVAHLRSALPNEGCGLLAVSADGVAARFYPGENLDASPKRFTMDPVVVIAAFKDMEARGWRLGAIVHSHPRTPATPSMTDLREAHYPSALMLIASLAGEAPELRAWAITTRPDAGRKVLGERPIRRA